MAFVHNVSVTEKVKDTFERIFIFGYLKKNNMNHYVTYVMAFV